MSSIGNELDQTFYSLDQRVTRLEKKKWSTPSSTTLQPPLHLEAELSYSNRAGAAQGDVTDRIAELVDHQGARVNGDLERIETELNDRIDEVQGFDPDELRCDLDYEIEQVRDSISYESDRIDNFEYEYITESSRLQNGRSNE